MNIEPTLDQQFARAMRHVDMKFVSLRFLCEKVELFSSLSG